VRDEGPFLVDWIAHHLTVGFAHVLVFSNDCRDGTDAMLDRLAALVPLTHVRNDGPHRKSPQWDALDMAAQTPLVREASWIAVLDIDEFVNIHTGDRTLAALVDAVPGATAFAMTWRLFGNGGVVTRGGASVPETFVRAAPADLRWPWRASMFKTLYRNDGSYRRPGVHRPLGPDAGRIEAQHWVDGSGRPLPAAFRTTRVFTDPGQDRFALVQLNHYALGSMTDYLVKVDRGRANRDGAPFDMSYWVDRNFTTVEDPSILPLLKQARPLRDRLVGDREIARLHAAATAWRDARWQDLMLDEAYRALFARLLFTPPSRVLDRVEADLLLHHAARAAGAGPDR
jgi:hypothetical protein